MSFQQSDFDELVFSLAKTFQRFPLDVIGPNFESLQTQVRALDPRPETSCYSTTFWALRL